MWDRRGSRNKQEYLLESCRRGQWGGDEQMSDEQAERD